MSILSCTGRLRECFLSRSFNWQAYQIFKVSLPLKPHRLNALGRSGGYVHNSSFPQFAIRCLHSKSSNASLPVLKRIDARERAVHPRHCLRYNRRCISQRVEIIAMTRRSIASTVLKFKKGQVKIWRGNCRRTESREAYLPYWAWLSQKACVKHSFVSSPILEV